MHNEGVRCAEHDLAARPDGRCILCLRSETRRSARRVFVGLAIAAATTLVAGGTYRGARAALAAARHTSGESHAVAATAVPAEERSSPAEPKHDERVGSPSPPASDSWRAIASPSPPTPAGREPSEAAQSPEPRVTADPAPESPLPPVHVVVYTTSWCSVCKRAKKWMTAQRIDFEERDVEASMENARRMHAINARGGVPTFDIEGQTIIGFGESAVLAAIHRAADHRSQQLPW